MSVEEDLISSHSIESIEGQDGKPNLNKIFKSMERRKSIRIDEANLGLNFGEKCCE